MPKPKQRTEREFREQFVRTLRKLRKHVESSRRGDIDAWQDISVQLFMLLCDRVPVSLAARVIPNLSLHPLLVDISKIKHNYLLIDAVQKSFTPDGIEFELFDLTRQTIPLDEWLNQTLLYMREETPKDVLDSLPWVHDSAGGMTKDVPETLRGEPTDITIEKLISETRNQMGGGHFTPTVRAFMQKTESVVVSEKGINQPYHVKCLIAIAEYVVPELERQLADLQIGSNG